jgi:hypothetical protein
MANLSKTDAQAALQAAGIPRRSFSVPEFCARNSLSIGFYRRLRKLGIAPRETRILDRIFITVDDEADWLKARATTEPAA